MLTLLFRLRFTGPVHFGVTGIGMEDTQETLPSDALTSAVINAFAVLDLAPQVVQELHATPPAFVLSSLFPYGKTYKETSRGYLLPKPLSAPVVADDTLLRKYGKDIKKIRYLSAEDMGSWLDRNPLNADALETILKTSRLAGGGDGDGNRKPWWRHELRPRVALDRSSQNSAIWLCDTVHFSESSGLFGLVSFNDPSWMKPLESAFHLLGDLGLGGERTYGMGTFEFSGFEEPPQNISALLTMECPCFVLLSSYYPAENERTGLAQDLVAWDFREVRGRVVSGRTATTLKRKRVRMLTEGSVLSRPLKGTVIDVSPEDYGTFGLNHPVYRSGLAFVAPQGGL